MQFSFWACDIIMRASEIAQVRSVFNDDSSSSVGR